MIMFLYLMMSMNLSKEDTRVTTNPLTSCDSSFSFFDNENLAPNPLFPYRPEPPKKERYVDDEILDVFKKVEVNLPLLTIIKSILRFAKCLKELCTNK